MLGPDRVEADNRFIADHLYRVDRAARDGKPGLFMSIVTRGSRPKPAVGARK
jgi:hypothetical protein